MILLLIVAGMSGTAVSRQSFANPKTYVNLGEACSIVKYRITSHARDK